MKFTLINIIELLFIGVYFSKLTDSNQIFRNCCVCIHYHLCKISSQIIEWKMFAPYDVLEILNTYSML